MGSFVLHVNNSFCSFSEDLPPEVSQAVEEVLTYQNDIGAEKNMIFGKLQYAKRTNNKKLHAAMMAKLKQLEADEWVCWFKNNQFPTGHFNIVKDLLDGLGASYSISDSRTIPKSYLILPWANKPYPPRYYQKEMIDLGLSEGRGVFESAVGSGKSLVMTYLIKQLAVNSLVIVPSRGLLEQLYREFVTWFGTKNVQIVDSQKVRRNDKFAPIRVITIQSLAALQNTGDLKTLIQDVDALFLDEFHHAGAASYTNLLTEIDHIYYRFGFTGTFLRNDSKILDMWGFLSNKLYTYPAWKAIQEGYLTPLTVISHEIMGSKSPSYQKEYDKNYCGNPELISKVYELCSIYGQDQQILILVNKKDKAGKIFHEVLSAHGIESRYISGDDSKEVINNTISDFNDKKFNILIGSSVVGEGIDVRSTDHLLMCQGGKSEVVIVQAVGRVVRLYENKHSAIVHDFNFLNTKYMRKHYEQRLNIYERNFEPTFENA